MKLHFESNQHYQWEAVKSITDIFEGQPLSSGDFDFNLSTEGSFLNEKGIGNNLIISEEQILKNVKQIQQRNEIQNPVKELQGMNFSVEMETGTGKTYVYLKTIYELNKLYGFKKFVIVVPSIAIREGVLKNLQITHEHFQSLYDKASISFDVYDSKKVSNMRGFSAGNSIQILVINIDSFAKDENIINKPNDKLTGNRPIEFIQNTKPIVIVDEPQNMETEIRKKAIEKLNPLCTLRYSATHTNIYNLLYSLNPVKAYDLGLVKQIEVDSVMSQNDYNDSFIQLEKIIRTGNNISAKVKLDVIQGSGVRRKTVTARGNKLDLYELSCRNEKYIDLQIYEIDFGRKQIELTNGIVLAEGQSRGGMNDEVMEFMMRKAIEEHLKKERDYKSRGIKVLTLFFIDKVKNYREYDDSGNPVQGKFAKWFENIYQNEITKPIYKDLIQYPVSEIHNGYFSTDNKGRIKDTGGETQADDDTYKLIMKEKEKLLELNTPLRFIFSHSVLREGWDNPNVFQICTLNETKSEIKKRQEIGRGLRLPVDQNGSRIFDKNINRLTIIANESYEDFARALQNEIEEECGVNFTGRIKNKNKREKLIYRKGFDVDPKFLEIWEKIKYRTKYSIDYKTDELIKQAAKFVKEMPETKKPSIISTKGSIVINVEGIKGKLMGAGKITDEKKVFEIPDVLSYIQSKTELTRDTILKILKKSGRIIEIYDNPQMFMDNSVNAIKKVLNEIIVEGIKYEKIGEKIYEMRLFNETELEIYIDEFTHKVIHSGKTIYENFIPLDSRIESKFAEDCESNENIEFYFKLPYWFKISTPIGNYNPDWAIIFKNKMKIYFIAETKSSGGELRPGESLKLKCGKAHFKNFKNVVYKKVTTVKDLY